MTDKKSKKRADDGWDAKGSYIEVKNKADGRVAYQGIFAYHGVQFRFHLTQQNSGEYLMRGEVHVVDPQKGGVLTRSSRDRMRWFKERGIEDAGQRVEALLVKKSLYGKSKERQDVKRLIEAGVLSLYEEHAAWIHRVAGDAAQADTIIPVVAANRYGEKFFDVRHPGIKESSLEAYKKRLSDLCAKLPAKAMRKFSMTEVQRLFDKEKTPLQYRKHLHEFWQYCIDTGVCDGANPVPVTKRRGKSATALMNDAGKPDKLTDKQQERLDDLLLKDPNGSACGISLMRYGGFSAKQAVEFCWSDVIWHDDPDYVRIKFFRDDIAGATHDYTAPIFPVGALVLRARYIELMWTYSQEELLEMPIASQVKDPKKKMNPNELIQNGRLMLLNVGYTYATLKELTDENLGAVSARIFSNTYKRNLYQNCRLTDDDGDAKYLMGESLTDNVTNNHYISFSCEASADRFHTMMSVLQKKEDIDKDVEVVVLGDGKEKLTLYPKDTWQRVGCKAFYVLKPNEELAIICPHGAEGEVQVREIREDGSIRRKDKRAVS